MKVRDILKLIGKDGWILTGQKAVIANLNIL